MPVKIGIPRTLAFYIYYPLWKTFFENLGLEVVVSGPTTKGILDAGIQETVNDACIPIKLYHGHVASLRGEVDYLFAPRLVSVRKFGTETFCPKFLGLPDMVKASIKGLPELIDIRVDLKKGRLELWRIARKLGQKFGCSGGQTLKAFCQALRVHRRYRGLLESGLTPPEAFEVLAGGVRPAGNEVEDLRFAVVGFPYAVYDRFINTDLVTKLKSMGVKILTMETIPNASLLEQARKLPKNLFWNFSNMVMQAALYYIEEKVDGIIHVTAFGCGPDAMVDKMIELEAKNRGKIPFMALTIDEHTGEGGMLTRIEAFVDMLRLRRAVE